MLKRSLIVALTCVVLASSAAHAMRIDMPLEIVAAKSPIIVIAKVKAATWPAKMQVALPGYRQPVKGWFRDYTVTITRVVKNAGSVKLARGKEVVVVTRSAAPRNGGPLVFIADGPAYPNLKNGSEYLLLLSKLPDSHDLYLVPAYLYFRPSKPAEIAKYAKAADVDKWPWGKAVNGLQLTMILRRPETWLPRGIVRRRVRKNGKWVTVQSKAQPTVHTVTALRNVSDKPIKVRLYQGDKFLTVSAVDTAGRTIKPDLYYGLNPNRMPVFDAGRHVATIAPGKIEFIAHYGKGPYGMSFQLPVYKAGKYTLSLSYTAKTDGFWKGTLASKPALLTLKAFPKRTPRNVGPR